MDRTGPVRRPAAPFPRPRREGGPEAKSLRLAHTTVQFFLSDGFCLSAAREAWSVGPRTRIGMSKNTTREHDRAVRAYIAQHAVPFSEARRALAAPPPRTRPAAPCSRNGKASLRRNGAAAGTG